jgi:hypothetical protein
MLWLDLKITAMDRNKYQKVDLKMTAQDHGIETEYEEEVTIEGSYEKPKGLLQVLWEHGFIDDSRRND